MTAPSDKNPLLPDLADLTDFQFAPAWAKSKSSTEFKDYSTREPRGTKSTQRGAHNKRPYSDERPQGDRREQRPFNPDGRPQRREGGFKNSPQDRNNPRSGKFEHSDRFARPERPPLEPTAGIRVEIRPVDSGLSSIAREIQLHKRCYSLYDLAKVIMAARERYELWFIKEENGPNLIHCKKSPAIWLEQTEALNQLWQSPWFKEFYQETIEEVAAPKGQFNAVARCGITDTLIGPVNWHGYQAALLRHHADKLPNMPLERFRAKITLDKSEEAIAQWVESSTKRIAWIPTREGAQEVILKTRAEVDADFSQHHYNSVFDTTGKCFVNGNIQSKSLASGLFAHLLKLTENARRYPAQIIPNICHGLARHHLPIFKLNGGHYTGPSRPHSLPQETILAERPAAIMAWIAENPGKKIDLMLKELAPSPDEGETVPTPKALENITTIEVAQLGENPSPAFIEEIQEKETPEPIELSENIEEPLSTTESIESSESTTANNTTESAATPEKVDEPSETAENKLIKAHTCWISDLLWLLQQGFILVMPDGKAYCSKQDTATPSAVHKENKKPKKTGRKQASKEAPSATKEKKPSDNTPKKPLIQKQNTRDARKKTPLPIMTQTITDTAADLTSPTTMGSADETPKSLAPIKALSTTEPTSNITDVSTPQETPVPTE